ncbi:sensor histidine kinase [Thalassospira sp. TSL5-1]|uniref:sensor histidine kinase n=1 Tax=Thalassospira sp. TSL5-1 TaxID=1544451 RepID=UPI00093A77C2|nr:sensor histidine kinase [Thalassospira sp. TSL5-1]OKH89509.1 hypothetical protein LF95_05965 [Thalassospira sp. TSL5-1]
MLRHIWHAISENFIRAVGATLLPAIFALFLSPATANAQLSFVKSINFSQPSTSSEFDLSLDDHVFRLIDPDHKLSFREVAIRPIGDFQPLLNTPGPGYTHASVWYRADIRITGATSKQPIDEQGKRLFLEISPPFLDRVNVAILDVNADTFIWRNEMGDNVPFSSDTIRNRNLTARLPYLTTGHYRILFRVETTSTSAFSARLLNDATLMTRGGRMLIISSVIVASLFVIGGVYLTGGILIRDMILFWYGAYVLSFALLGVGMSGLGLLLLQPLWTPINDLITGSGSALSVATSVILWVKIIDIRQISRKIYKFYRAYCIIAACMVTITCTPYYTDFGRYFLTFHLFVLISMFGWLIYRFLQNPRGIFLFYLFTMGIPTLAALIYILAIVGIAPHSTFTQTVYPVATMFHLVMMGIAMAYRTSYLEKARAAAQGRRHRTHQLAEEQREFITMLGHEFRTPLAIIQRSAELISLHLGHAGKGISDRMARIRNHAGQLSALVDVFLTKDTLDRGAFNLNRRYFTLLEFLSDLVEALDQEGKQIDISLHGDADTAVNADPTLLKLAIGNVIENARKYAPNSPILIDCNHRGDGYAYIRVVDHGPGMSDDDLSQVSMAFYRGKTSDGTRGVGLGLHIANRILEAHSGSITLSVAEKGGTTVVFRLPLDRDATIHNIRHRNTHRLNSSRVAHQTGAE